jgi:hypothetical protein
MKFRNHFLQINVKAPHRIVMKLAYSDTDAWHSDHLATTSRRLKLNISTMFTYLLTRRGDLETAACWTPLFACGVQSSVSSIETTKGNIRFKPQWQFHLLCPGMGSNDKNVSWEEGNSHEVPDMSLGAELHQRVLLAAVY